MVLFAMSMSEPIVRSTCGVGPCVTFPLTIAQRPGTSQRVVAVEIRARHCAPGRCEMPRTGFEDIMGLNIREAPLLCAAGDDGAIGCYYSE